MKQAYRLDGQGMVDHSRSYQFTFNGRKYTGHPGDTLASALLANGVRLVARSFKYHRPRGILSAGVEEPNALVQLDTGAATVPNLKATEIPLYDGLTANSVNAYPSVHHDLAGGIDYLSRFLPAGFYYKTFFASPWLWSRLFEPLIRQAGGWGKAPAEPDPDRYDRHYLHCDVLVVGGGAAGLTAARTAAAQGAGVLLADEHELMGGTLLHRKTPVNGENPAAWVSSLCKELDRAGHVRLLPRTTVFGYYDDNYLTALQQLEMPDQPSSARQRPRQRLLHIRAGQVILATGAHERPMLFANNDRPGIMLAGAVQAYLNRWGLVAGQSLVLFTNNDRAYECAGDLIAAGARLSHVIDSRTAVDGPLQDRIRSQGVTVLGGHAVIDTRGRKQLRKIIVAPLENGGTAQSRRRMTIPCDLLALSGGYSPVVHLHCQSGGTLRYDDSNCCFRPSDTRQAQRSAGACNGIFRLSDILREGHESGLAAAVAAGFTAVKELPAVPYAEELEFSPPEPIRLMPSPAASTDTSKYFVDLQNDTTVADIQLAAREGFESVEHMKRYTLAGFGTDQGKTSNINALAVLAGTLGIPVQEVGTTTFRPPYTAVSFAAMGGRDRGELFDPARLTSIHDHHVKTGAVFENVGQWKRPWYYPRPGEDMQTAVLRECRAVRAGVGMLDASTLGKIDIQGPDAVEFLNRIYTSDWDTLQPGRVRYGVMCREDGMVFDDGTTTCIAENHYLMTTTTGGAAAVFDHLEEYLQTEWPELRVRLTSVTEQWATVAVAGPRSRNVLQRLAPEIDFSPGQFPFMSWQDTVVADLPARIFRISFTGELSYEINVPWYYGAALWEAIREAGAAFDITPYGTETMHVLRAEKGFIIVGQETDGARTPSDLGLDRLVSTDKDFIGRRSLQRPDCLRAGRKQLVGLLPEPDHPLIAEGTQLVAPGTAADPPPVPMQGFVTSSYHSAALDSNICLALVSAGRQRHGEVIEAAVAGKPVPVTICSPVFYDPEGRRRDGEQPA